MLTPALCASPPLVPQVVLSYCCSQRFLWFTALTRLAKESATFDPNPAGERDRLPPPLPPPVWKYQPSFPSSVEPNCQNRTDHFFFLLKHGRNGRQIKRAWFSPLSSAWESCRFSASLPPKNRVIAHSGGPRRPHVRAWRSAGRGDDSVRDSRSPARRLISLHSSVDPGRGSVWPSVLICPRSKDP